VGQPQANVQEVGGHARDGCASPAVGEAELASGARLFATPATFLLSAAGINDLPDADRVEVAFAGRSNVGKSSLLNALTGRRALARVSNTPGRTQTLNYYRQGAGLYLVDMPGYGYARASKAAIRQWTALIFEYLRGRATLARVFLLIDARHGIKEPDEKAMRLLDEAAVSYQVVFTKTDKISQGDHATLIGRTADALRLHGAAHPHILATSARQRLGLAELGAAIAALTGE
jgi:GTP-binding protein